MSRYRQKWLKYKSEILEDYIYNKRIFVCFDSIVTRKKRRTISIEIISKETLKTNENSRRAQGLRNNLIMRFRLHVFCESGGDKGFAESN